MNRLLPIEGLRAYLAIWVVITHVMFFSVDDYHGSAANDLLTLSGKFFGDGGYAVRIFMIISGFVIFFLLDKRRESYGQFIIRRFFRLYPLYIVLLLTAILALPLTEISVESAQSYMSAHSTTFYNDISNATKDHWNWNVLLHLVMLQGIFPNDWLGLGSCYSFIIAAWSISVEWEFYLVAPLLYLIAASKNGAIKLVSLLAILALFYYLQPKLWFDAFLPVYLPFFLLGIGSYFVFKTLHPSPPDTAFPIALALAVTIYLIGNRVGPLIPIVLWIPFLGLICENRESLSSRLFLWIFNNRVAQFLGAISYGIYLSHELMIMLMQHLLIKLVPNQDKTFHFVILLGLTFTGTVLLAALLHRLIELPGMELGRKLAARIKAKPLGR